MVDPNFLTNLYLTIGINIASNGLTSLIAQSSKEIQKLLAKKEDSEQTEEITLQTLFEYAINDLDKRTTLTPSKGREILSLFLHSSEVEEIVRQIYSADLEDKNVSSNLETIRTMFVALLTHYFASYPTTITLTKRELQSIANPLFNALLKACETTLNAAIERGIIAAHEAKEVFRFNIIRSQLASIQKELEFLPSVKKLNIKAIVEFEKQYRERVGQRHGRIIPPNLNSAQPHPIDALYVYPKFAQVKGESKLEVSKDDLFSSSFRSVILGNPGGGKSTLALKLCYELATNYSNRVFAGRRGLTPILVILRNYGAEKKEHKCSILDFIEAEVRSTYQLQASPFNTFQYLLLTGRAMVIFDGLDELLDTSYRQEIRDDVELFCSSYPSAPILVTSREIGYEQAPLDKNMFQVFQLDQFDDKQVKEYVTKWFNVAEIEEAEKQRRTLIETFLKDSEVVKDLRSNPLMLALLCTIYREEHYIPRYRPDVYEKCAIMLFERWDKSRSIYQPPLPEEHIRPLMEYLANWIYSDEHLRAGVTEEELANKTTAYLHEWIYENFFKAERTAQEFIKFCVGRAWVLTDTGTKKEGERLYQFVHTTFLEYFTASYYVRSCRTPKNLLDILKPKIAKREWDVMAQLAFQLQHKKNVGAGDELLKNLVEESGKYKGEGGKNILSFSIRCLKFIVPRPEVRRLITNAFLERSLKENKLSRENDLFGILLEAAPENLTTIINTLVDSIVDFISNDSHEKASIFFELLFGHLWMSARSDNEKILSIVDKLIKRRSSNIDDLYSNYFYFGYNNLWFGKINILEFIKLYGTQGLSFRYKSKIYMGLHHPIIEILAFYISGGYSSIREELASKTIHLLNDLGMILPTYALPWFSTFDLASLDYEFKKSLPLTNEMDNNILFGIFIVMATFIEAYKLVSPNVKEYINGTPQHLFNEYDLNTPKTMFEIKRLLLYFSEESNLGLLTLFSLDIYLDEKKVNEILNQYRFTKEQCEFIKSWLNHKISLIDSKENQ